MKYIFNDSDLVKYLPPRKRKKKTVQPIFIKKPITQSIKRHIHIHAATQYKPEVSIVSGGDRWLLNGPPRATPPIYRPALHTHTLTHEITRSRKIVRNDFLRHREMIPSKVYIYICARGFESVLGSQNHKLHAQEEGGRTVRCGTAFH